MIITAHRCHLSLYAVFHTISHYYRNTNLVKQFYIFFSKKTLWHLCSFAQVNLLCFLYLLKNPFLCLQGQIKFYHVLFRELKTQKLSVGLHIHSIYHHYFYVNLISQVWHHLWGRSYIHTLSFSPSLLPLPPRSIDNTENLNQVCLCSTKVRAAQLEAKQL